MWNHSHTCCCVFDKIWSLHCMTTWQMVDHVDLLSVLLCSPCNVALQHGMKRKFEQHISMRGLHLSKWLFPVPRAALHGNGGPLRHLVQQALTAGQQSAQLLGLVALHLAGLLVQCPPVALLYLADIQKLLVCDVRDISLKVQQTAHAY